MGQKYYMTGWWNIIRNSFLLVWEDITSLPDYETGSRGKGSTGRCSEREESRFLDTWSVICQEKQDPAMHFHLFAPSSLLCSPRIWLYSPVVLLTPNQIKSAGDTLLLSPPEFSTQRIFCLLIKKSVITGAGEIMRAGDERRGRKERVSPRLLNHKWVRGVSEHEAHWCEMASWALVQSPTHSSQRSGCGKQSQIHQTSGEWLQRNKTH